jgi:hypothetical protein
MWWHMSVITTQEAQTGGSLVYASLNYLKKRKKEKKR